MSTLETYEFKVINKLIKAAIPVTGAVNGQVKQELGLLHERALAAEENGSITHDEFMQVRDILRGYGLTELFY